MKTFDREKALSVTGGDTGLLGELLNLFCEQRPKQLTDISDAIKTGQSEQLQSVAHALKGALGNLGGMHAFNLAQALEKMGMDNKLQGAETVFQQLEASVLEFEKQSSVYRSDTR